MGGEGSNVVGGQSAFASEDHRAQVPTGAENPGEVLSGHPSFLHEHPENVQWIGLRQLGLMLAVVLVQEVADDLQVVLLSFAQRVTGQRLDDLQAARATDWEWIRRGDSREIVVPERHGRLTQAWPGLTLVPV
jgi:hypothetical protein